MIELLQGSSKTTYFYATIAFLAGFSERRAKVLLDSAAGAAFGSSEDRKRDEQAAGGVFGSPEARPLS